MKFFGKKIIYIFITALLILGAFFFYFGDSADSEKGDIPIISADKTTFRMKPEAGSDITSNKYNPIYDQMKSQQYNTSSVNITPSPEIPILIESSGDDSITQIVSDKITSESEVTEPEKLEPESSKKKLIIIDEGAHSENATKIRKTKRQIYVQIASTRNKEDAEKEFRRISKNHKKILSGYAHRIEKFDIKNKGRYYKLLVGPIESASKAQLVCKKLINSGISCIMKGRKE
jgi:SPOR domain